MAVSQTGFTPIGRIVTITNPYTEIAMHQALDLQMQGRYEEALEAFDHVLELDPHEARALHAKGDIFDLMGRFEDAVESYTKALEYDPFNAETWYNRGVTLGKMGREKEGEESIVQAVTQAV